MSCLLSWGGHNIIKFKEKYLKNPFSTQELVCDFFNPAWPFQIGIRTKANICQLENIELYSSIIGVSRGLSLDLILVPDWSPAPSQFAIHCNQDPAGNCKLLLLTRSDFSWVTGLSRHPSADERPHTLTEQNLNWQGRDRVWCESDDDERKVVTTYHHNPLSCSMN